MARRKKTRGSFSMLRHDVFTSPEFAQLSAVAVKALIDLFTQFRGTNNGNLCAAWKVMHPRGWVSKDTLSRALLELLDRGWITVTRQGGRRIATLFAVTWLPVNKCDIRLDVAASPYPSNAWKRLSTVIPLSRLSGQCAPTIGAIKRGSRA